MSLFLFDLLHVVFHEITDLFILLNHTYGVLGFWWFLGLRQNLVRKVTSFRPTDFGRRVFWVVATRGCVLSVLVQVWDVCGPWNLDVATKLDVRKVTSFRPTSDFGPDL